MMIVKKIDYRVATLFVQERHYSPVMPKLTKHHLGAYVDDELVGVLTLGWGTVQMSCAGRYLPWHNWLKSRQTQHRALLTRDRIAQFNLLTSSSSMRRRKLSSRRR